RKIFFSTSSGTFDPNIPEEGPSAPPPGWLDDFYGKKILKMNVGFCSSRVPTISEEVARNALLKFVESKWRYSSKPARNLIFKDLRPVTVYRYRLETYSENRTSSWQFEPVDGAQFGVSPPPWDIPVSLPQRFTDRVEKIRVPHSCIVKVQLILDILGRYMCHICSGCGRVRCGACSGRAVAVFSPSLLRCTSCHGYGFKTCSVCHGSQNLMHYILLTTSILHFRSVFFFLTMLPVPFHGVLSLSRQVYPIQGFPDQEICDVSTKLINDHLERFSSSSRILQQVRRCSPSTLQR
uniref:Ssu-2 homolog, tandem duplicate 1 n=1 Tax=Mola mola TaxID=94237 RepID=A0A3Q3X0L8_MOLML